MMNQFRAARTRVLFLALSLTAFLTAPALLAAASNDCWQIDHRYAPPDWQTAICLPDDWQKTLVAKDGSLLYDYGGKRAGFGTRIQFELAGEMAWQNQELRSPRVPIVGTVHRSGRVEVLQEAFAVAPLLHSTPAKSGFVLERVGNQAGQVGWASPPVGTDRRFANVAIGWNEPIQYRFRAQAGRSYHVALGFCEGHHSEPGQRILELQVEGKALRSVDLVAEAGRNKPILFVFPATDENNDGWVDLTVAAAENARDKNTILNTLWVFDGADQPNTAELMTGASKQQPLARIGCSDAFPADQPTRHDVVLVHLRNTGATDTSVTPVLNIACDSELIRDASPRRLQLGGGTALECTEAFTLEQVAPNKTLLRFPERTLWPRSETTLAFAVTRGKNALSDRALKLDSAKSLLRRTERFWEEAALPYNRLQVPDPSVQALLDSSVRNIYQAREIKNGLPAFQVGPTCYRGLWVVDGSFLLEAMTYLGRADETREGVKYLMSFQRPDGSFMLMNGHWKETAIAIWAITRHARLTGDPAWLREVWPKVERGFEFIRHMRTLPPADAPNARLIPDGFSDGGLSDSVPEYTNIYWTLAGMRAAVEGARWLGRNDEAADWQKEFMDFYQTFRRAAARDMRKDSQGNSYLPIRMRYDGKILPQKAQWAFLHSVFPGKVFTPNDPLVQGNLAMLKAAESQDLVLDTGWLKQGIWTYFGSFYGHAWLWLGNGDKAARTLYAFGNHASPLLAWREEQMPVGQGDPVVGDMPHNWASAEFIRLVRHSLILERGNELHLFEALPAAWVKPGAVTKATGIATEFGPVSFELRVARDGSSATLKLTPPTRTPSTRVVLHLDHWSGRTGTEHLPLGGPSTTKIPLP